MKFLRNLLVLLLISFFSIAQTRYSSLNDACTRRVTDVSKTVFAPYFSIDNYVFLNNDNRNFKRLTAGYYYYPSSNASFQTNFRGKIINIQPCIIESPSGFFPAPPNSTEIGIIGTIYGTDYDVLKNEISGGTTKFDFYGKSNGQPYPTGLARNGNGYETFNFPSHSITTSDNFAGVISKCRYKLTDSQSNVVIFVEDTRGGFHPNYGNNLRGNNHPDDCARYLPVGTYTLEYTNISDAPIPILQRLKFWYQDQNQINYLIDEIVNKNQTVVRQIVITDTGATPSAIFKLNNNFIN
jgi:hypothetical protein